jgi:hypothetical protein
MKTGELRKSFITTFQIFYDIKIPEVLTWSVTLLLIFCGYPLFGKQNCLHVL